MKLNRGKMSEKNSPPAKKRAASHRGPPAESTSAPNPHALTAGRRADSAETATGAVKKTRAEAKTKTATKKPGTTAAKRSTATITAGPLKKGAKAQAPAKSQTRSKTEKADKAAASSGPNKAEARKISSRPSAAKKVAANVGQAPKGRTSGLGETAARTKTGVKSPALKKKPSPRDLADIVAAAASEHKPVDPVLLDLSGLSSVADWFFIVSADNPRQMNAIAEKIIRRAREHGYRPLGSEGLGKSGDHWVLVDLGDVVVHIFNLESRDLYDLEGLWTDAPRRVIK